MNEQIKYKKVGWIHSAQGLKGEVFVVCSVPSHLWLEQCEQIGLGSKEDEAPAQFYKVQKSRPHKKQGLDGEILLLENVSTKNQSDLLVKQSLFVPQDLFVSQKGEDIFLSEILYFRVIDEARGAVGEIIDFDSNGAQDLLVLQWRAQEWLVPLVKEFIVQVDFENKTIYMKIPQGLLEDL